MTANKQLSDALSLRSASEAGSVIKPWETRPQGDDAMEPDEVNVFEGSWAVVMGTNAKPAGWVDTHALFASQTYRDQILPALEPSAACKVVISEERETLAIQASTMARIVKSWLDWQEEQHGPGVPDDAYFYSVPTWPSRGALKAWHGTLTALSGFCAVAHSEDECAPPMTTPAVKAEHQRIWLEPAGAPDRCWCQDNQWGDDGVEYVLATASVTGVEMEVVATAWKYMGDSTVDFVALLDKREIEQGRVTNIEPLVRQSDAAALLSTLSTQVQRLTEENEALRKERDALANDRARLDYLDSLNAALNARYGTKYGWELIVNHNVTRAMFNFPRGADLNDAAAHGFKSCRDAIDRRMAEGAAYRRAQAGRAALEGSQNKET